MSTALYRRYRPDSFAEVIGQDHVTEPLRQALRNNQVNHAYLFSGPRGCGKTSSARILARCLNCAEGPTDTPCGKCESCVELATGGPGSLDVVEIDAASHGGVDDARDLRERATFAPARDRYKIFILDEAHMVSPQGFNALLKIVEEPPPHIKFIFATTEPEKVIGTIRSRTHHYPFRLVPPEDVVAFLETLCAAENIRVGEGVLPLVVRAGGGSMRDTLSVLDQLIAGAADGELEYNSAVALLGYTSAGLLDETIDALGTRDGAEAFAIVQRVISTGHEPRRFVEDLLERLRDLIVISAAGSAAAAALRQVPQDQFERMVAQAAQFSPRQLNAAAATVHDALNEMGGVVAAQLQLELLVARLLLLPDAASPAPAAAPAAPGAQGQTQSQARPGQAQSGAAPAQTARPAAAAAAPAAAGPAPAAARPTPADATRAALAALQQEKEPASAPVQAPASATESVAPAEPVVAEAVAAPASAPAAPAEPESASAELEPEEASADDAHLQTLRTGWPQVAQALQQHYPEIYGVVRGAEPVAATAETLVLGFNSHPAAQEFAASGHAAKVSDAIAYVLKIRVEVTGKILQENQGDEPPQPSTEPPSDGAGDSPKAEAGQAAFNPGLTEAASGLSAAAASLVAQARASWDAPATAAAASLAVASALSSANSAISAAASAASPSAPSPAGSSAASGSAPDYDFSWTPAADEEDFPEPPSPTTVPSTTAHSVPDAPAAASTPASAPTPAAAASEDEASADDPAYTGTTVSGVDLVLQILGGTILEQRIEGQ